MKSLYSFLSRVNSASNVKLSASTATNPTENLLKKFILRTAGVIALLLVFGGSVMGQTQLIDPAGGGGFESATDFAGNGWTVANFTSTNTNKWFVGSAATPNVGSRCAYISDNASGTTNNYTITLASRVLFWRDITFPAGESTVTLSFTYRGAGESSYDDLSVFFQSGATAPAVTQPASSSNSAPAITNATRIVTLSGISQYTTYTYTLSAGNASAATTRRLIFYWENDTSTGTQPPAAIDNISLISSTPAVACSGTPAPGNTVLSNSTICSGGTTNLSLQNAVTGNNLIYNWQSSLNNSTWTNMYELVNSSFASLPANTNVYGNASLGSGELILTPNTGSNTGGYVIQNTMGVNSNSFRASFDYRINDGGGADGMSLSFAPTINNDAGGGEAGEGSGIRVCFDTYYTSANSQIVIYYNSCPIWSNTLGAFNLRNASYQNVILSVDNVGRLSLSIAGTAIVTSLALPPAYLSANKSTWKFKFSARTGGVSDKHSIDNLLITFNNVPSPPAVSATSTTYYRCQVTCGASTGTSNVATLTVHNPSIDWANLQSPATGTICASGTFNVYGQVYKAGYTEAAGADANFQVQAGYSTTNTDPSTWTNWNTATWNVQSGNNDEYMYTFPSTVFTTAGTYYYAFRYRYLSCGSWVYGGTSGFWSSTANNGVLTVNAAPTANAGSALSNICRGTSTVQMGGSVGGGATNATWTGGSGSWTNANSAANAVYNAAANESGTITLTLTATAPTGCTNVTATKTLIFTAVSATPTITGPICPGNTTVTGTGVNGSSIKVIRGGVEIQSGSPTWNGSNWSITVSSLSAGNSLTATQTESGKCISDASAAYVVITPASWGNIQFPASGVSVCGSPVTIYGQVFRAGTTEGAGQGASLTADLGWSSSNTDPNTWTNWTSATFNAQQGSNDEFRADLGAGLTEGTWYYAFRYSYAGCPIYGGYGGVYGSGGSNGTATVPASHTAVLSSDAGSNAQTVCKGTAITSITYTLGNGANTANVTGLPTGVSASVNGGVLAISGSPSVSGNYTYTVTTSGTSNCAFTFTGTISVSETLDYANLQFPSSAIICQGGTANIFGQVYEPGLTEAGGAGAGITAQYGYSSSNTNPSGLGWTWTNANFNAQSGNNDEYTGSFGSSLAAGTYYYTMRYTYNGCTVYGGFNSGEWNGTTNVNGVLTINAAPTAIAGTAISTCSNSSAVSIVTGASATNNLGTAWTSSGTGSFSATNTVSSSSYTPSAADITAGSVTLTLTATANSGCSNASSTKTLTITAAPTASAGTAISTCSNSGAVSIVTGASATNNAGTAWSSSGTGTFSATNTVSSSSYTPSAADIASGSITLTLTATGNGTCSSTTSSKTLTINSAPSAPIASDNARCGTGTVAISASSSGAVIDWYAASSGGSVLTTGTPNPASGTNSFTTPSIAATTIYHAQARNATTGCLSSTRTAVTATVNTLPTVTFTAQPGATACLNTDLTYTTQSGQSNYAWTFPGTLNTDYTITSGGTSSSNTVTLKYLTTGSKTVSVNYTSGNCSAVSATNSTATTISALPTVNAGADFNLCSGQTIAMNASTNAVGPTISTSTSATYSLGATSSEYIASPTTSTNSSCPIPLSVTIPAGATITGVNVSYSVTTANAQYMNENYSYLQCTSTGGVKESALTQGVGGSSGTYNYSRSNLSIANGVTGGGTINFKLHLFRIYGGSGCNTTYSQVNNNTFTITVNYTYVGNPTYAWSPATGLSATNVLNPSSSATSAQTYTLTVTGGNGCSSSDQVVVNILNSPVNPTATVTGSSVINVGGTTALSATGSNITWYNAATGGTVLGAGSTLTTPVQCVPGTVTYYAEDNNGSCPSIRAAVSFTVRPVLAANPSNALICSTGGSVTLNTQLTGATGISWSPNTNLSTAAGSTTVASPTVTTIYTMNATVAGCGAVSGTQTVGVIDAVAFTPTSTPTAVCAGNPAVLASNLASSGFTVTPITVALSTVPGSGVTTLCQAGSSVVTPTSTAGAYTLDDSGWGSVPIGFNYNFFGTTYSSLNVGTNGVVQFGTYNANALADFTFTSLPNATEPLNIIAIAANDNNLSSGATSYIKYWTEGIAPTRTFVLYYNQVVQYATGPGTTTGQIKLFETTGNVEIHVSSSTSTNNKVVGLQNSDASIGAMPYSSTNSITNQAWKFIPGANYTFQWATAGSNISGATSTGYTTPDLSTAGTVTYSVAATNPNTQCTTTQSVNITVNALPAAPNSTGDVTACSTAGNQSLTVTAGAGETADWFAASTGGTVLASGDNVLSYSTATAGTYYAASQNTTTGCSSSSRTGVTLNVNASPSAPTVSTPVSYCQGSTATALTATAAGTNTLNWYSSAPSYPSYAGATALGSAPTPSTSTAGTTNYYVSQSSSSNSCESELALVAVTINATPSAPVASNPAAYCQGATASELTATSTAGNSLYWYTVPTGGTGSATAPIPSTAAAGTTDYFVANRNNTSTCEGSRTTVTVTVNPTITASVSNSASSTSACGGGSITFTATPTNGGASPTYQWYLNGSAVSGETSATYTLATPSDADEIYVEMTPSAQTCLASNAATASNTVTLTNTASTPTVAIQSSASTAFCPGTSVTFSVNSSSNMGATPMYQWNLNGTPIVGATTATYVTSALANNDQVSLTMTSSLSGSCLTQSSATSSSITSAVNSATAISTQPSVASACLGGSASFTVSATGTGTLTYQWKKNGLNVTGNATATSSTLTLSGIAAGDAANYTVDVTGTCGTVTSSAAALTINSATAISTQPSAASDCAGATVNFSVTASGQGTLTYQWRKDGLALNGETNATLSVNNISSANSGQYSVIVSGGCGNVTSSSALLAINAATVISTQPTASALCAGNTANFSVTASGTGTLSYQWKKDGSNVGTNSSTLSITNAQAANAGNYTVDVTGTCGAVTSSNALLTVNPLTTITTQPVAAFGCQGQSSTFTVVAAGTSPLTYQWKFNGVNISGATAASYNIPNATTENDGGYLVTVTGGCGAAVNSNTVVLDVYPTSVAGTVSANQAICSGNSPANITLSGNTGTIQWQSSSDNSTFANIDGATASTLTSAQMGQLNAATYYRAIVTSGGCSSATSGVVTVTVNPLPTASIAGATSVCLNATSPAVTFTGANGTAPYTFTYKINGGINQTVVTTSGNSVTVSVPTSTAGSFVYSLVSVADANCSQTQSGSATVTVNPLPTASISGTVGVCVNATTPNITFTGASGTAPYTFTYNINGGSNQTVTTTSGNSVTVSAPTSTAGVYAYNLVSVQDASSTACSQTQTGTATVTVTTAPNAGSITGTQDICANGSTTFNSNGDNGGTWTSGTEAVATVNASTGVITAISAGTSTITYTVTGSGGCSNATATRTVTVNSLPSSPTASSTSRCGAGTVMLTASANAGETTDWYAAASGGSALAQTTGTFTTPTLSSTTAYYVEARNTTTGCVSATRTAATVTINTPAVPSVTIASSASENTICSGETVTFTATPTNGGTIPSYQWKLNGVNVGTDNATYANSALVNNDVVIVVMTANNSCQASSTATSDGITTVVNALPATLTLTGSTFCSATSTTGTVTSSGSQSGVTYQLWVGNTDVINGNLPGTGSALIWSGIDANTGYYVIGTNSTTNCTSVNSNQVSVTSQAPTYSYYLDSDNDGFGTGTTVAGCNATAPAGYSLITGDCNNSNNAIYPTATELCGNNIDENCSGPSDDMPSYYRTIADGNWGDASTWETACAAGVTYTVAAYPPPSYYTGMVNIRDTHDVIIPANGTTYQTGTLDIDAGGSLTMTGNDYLNSPTTTTSTVNGVTTTTSNVSPVAKLTVTLLIDNAGTLNIGHQASLVQSSTTAANVGSGNINVESKLTGGNNGTAPNGRYWYVGSPMNNTSAGQFFDSQSPVWTRLWSYNATNNSWGVVIQSQTNTNSTLKLIPGIGYLYRAGANKTITYTGTAGANLNNNLTSNLLAPTQDATLVPVIGYNSVGYKFVANPYPSYVDWKLVTRSGLNVSYWIRNASNTAYEAFNATTSVSTSPSGQTTQFIPPMQGFWVYAFNSTPSLRIDNTDRVHSTNVLHTPVINQVVRLKLNDGKSSDYAVVYENELASNDFEETDTDKMFDYDFHQLYTMEGEHELALNGLLNATAKGSVNMGMVVPNNGPYTIEATDLEMEEAVILEDKFNHTFQDMKVNPIYSFTSNAGTFNNRFVLHFTNTETVGVGETVGETDGVSVYTTTGQQVKVWVTNTTEFQNATVKVYDAIGNLIERKNMTSNELLLDLDIANGIYVVEVTGAEKIFTKKVFISK